MKPRPFVPPPPISPCLQATVTQHVNGKQVDRTYAFDKVFGPHSEQEDLYDSAIRPIVEAGRRCRKLDPGLEAPPGFHKGLIVQKDKRI